MRPEGIGADAARLVVEVAVFYVVDYDAAGAGILAPDLHAFAQSFPLEGIKATRELRAELLKKLCGVDVRAPFEAATHQRPDHRERVEAAIAAPGVDQLRAFWRLRHRYRDLSRLIDRHR